MRIKELKAGIEEVANGAGFEVVTEYATAERARLDMAVLRGDEKVLAIEFEKTYKWIQQRILYNSVKAYRAGFRKIIFVYPFSQKAVNGSWVLRFIGENLGMRTVVVKPEDCLKTIEEWLK